MKENSLRQNVYNKVLDMIRNGEISSDEVFTEKMIIETSGCSKSPVREALQELCSDGYLIVIPRCGYKTKPISIKTMSEITSMRRLLELDNFDNIAPLFSKDEIDAAFVPIEEKHLKIQNSVFENNRYNEEFHLALANMGGNSLMIDYIKKLLTLYSAAYTQYYISMPKIHERANGDIHNEFLNAWKERDLKKAHDYLKMDIEKAFYVIDTEKK